MAKYYIYPAIGIARLGNSKSGFFLGPEVPHQDVNPNYTGNNLKACYENYSLTNRPDVELDYKDKKGRVKRQAARFRIFEVNDSGQVTREITADDATIKWEVQLANRKSINYKFEDAMDLGDSSKDCELRNAFVQDLKKRKEQLLIDPKPRTIKGKNKSGNEYHFDDGTIFGGTSQEKTVYLGELRTDEQGRLLVLGGRGHSSSYEQKQIETFANNDYWHDDISDGTVRAKIIINSEEVEAEPAMVAVTPPNFAPNMPGVVTMYDVVTDLMLRKHELPSYSAKTEFYRDIYPVLSSLVENQGVNLGYFMVFGDGSPGNFNNPVILDKLKSNCGSNKPIREAVFKLFRLSEEDTKAQRKKLVKELIKEGGNEDIDPALKKGIKENLDKAIEKSQALVQASQLPPIFGDLYGDDNDSPLKGLSLTQTQYNHMQKWADGDFIEGENAKSNSKPLKNITDPLETIEPVNRRPFALTQTNLEQCLGGPFHPGIELTWFMRRLSMWNVKDKFDPMRLNILPKDEEVQDYFGPVLTPHVALKEMFNASGPGTLTRFMGVPWQSDEGSCRSNQDYDPAQYLPTITYWSARVPNQVMSQRSFQQLDNHELSEVQRFKYFSYRQDWLRFLRENQENPRVKMVDNWDKMGIVVKKPIKSPISLEDTEVNEVWVESQVDDRYLVKDASYRQLLNIQQLAGLEGGQGVSAGSEDAINQLDKEESKAAKQNLPPRKIITRQNQR
ncbi:LodA/GoxA family CTQ-dependent oxidase [Pseudoalteromonas luteoviolacea]|uniref:LodA/GoxA family CTQ-dependent oxidase n=1 Tax=Pseudoalteromonas luteoviolacea TaxID=43657 RepID=UPI001F203155|nr:LodA/GoxA family CTQ-dependent oxidase [Pseudoalteromonas luteoviolacea]MCF6442967.1 LodA/GoxA family CTQ-dependent oxidase [Pseudoalteromonas luteoviolacea]